jgi:DNA invertase Pin-like site-specific DNA recombinase
MTTKSAEVRQVVLYARVSTTEQAEKDLSLPAQLDTLRRLAADRQYEVVAEYIEPGASGRDDQRPLFRRMMQEVLAPSASVNAILVVHTSRFMRDAGKAVVHKQALARRGIRVLSASQETADDPSGHLMETIYAGFDQYESEMNGYRTSAAIRENARRGFVNGSQAPFGYRASLVDTGVGPKRRKLLPEPSETATLREVFRLYIAHGGAKAVARELNQGGHRYRGGKLWTKDWVLRVLEETAVVGTYYWGKTDNRTGKIRDRDEWIAIPVEPTLDRDLFDAAQRVRKSRDPERLPGRTASSPLLLAGLICCGKCGASYVLETSGKATPAGEYSYRYYNCRGFVKSGKEVCGGQRVPVKKLDRAVLEHLAERVFTVERCRTLVRDIVEESGLLRQKTDEQRRELQQQIDDIDRRIARWIEAFETANEDRDIVMPRLRELRAKRDEMAATIAKVIPLRSPPKHLYAETTIKRFQETIRELILSADHTLAKNYLRFLVDRITVRETKSRSVAGPTPPWPSSPPRPRPSGPPMLTARRKFLLP